MKHLRYLFAFIFSTLTTCLAIAENPFPDNDLQIYHFPMDRSVLSPSYSNNSALINALHSLLSDPDVYTQIDSIHITAAASPIATRARNERLSSDRAAALKKHISEKYPYVDRTKIHTCFIGVDWEGFNALVKSDKDLPSKEEIYYLLTTTSRGDELLEKLRHVGGTETFAYLVDKIYPQLQYAAVRIRLKDGRYIPAEAGSSLKAHIERRTPNDTTHTVVFDTIRTVVYDTISYQKTVSDLPGKNRTPYYMSLKTNLLYDIALLPNLAVEFSLGKRWSLVAEGYWTWWNTGAPDWWYYRIQAAGLEVRKWFGNRTPLTGHFVGLYGMTGNYDIRLFTDNKEDIGYLSKHSWSTGLTYGYALPLSERWNLEFSIGVGYLTGTYQEYDRSQCNECFPWLSTKKMNYWGLTKASISLIGLIGTGNNRKEATHE